MKDEIILYDFNDKDGFHHLFQLYLSDLSKYNNMEVEENGLYSASWIDRDWKIPEFMPLQIELNHNTCGFILLSKTPYSKPGTKWCIQEFFVLREFRKKGIGRASVEQLFAIYPGSYSMAVMQKNKPALSFWEKTLDSLKIHYLKEQLNQDGIDGISYEFTTKFIV